MLHERLEEEKRRAEQTEKESKEARVREEELRKSLAEMKAKFEQDAQEAAAGTPV